MSYPRLKLLGFTGRGCKPLFKIVILHSTSIKSDFIEPLASDVLPRPVKGHRPTTGMGPDTFFVRDVLVVAMDILPLRGLQIERRGSDQ